MNPEKSYSFGFIPRFFNVASDAFCASSAVLLLIFNVYVSVLPASALTTTSTVLLPSFNATFPRPDIISPFDAVA